MDQYSNIIDIKKIYQNYETLYLSDDIMETCFVPDAKHHLLHQNMLLSYNIIQIFFTDNTSHYLARVVYVMVTFQLSWHLIQVIEINAGSIARTIT